MWHEDRAWRDTLNACIGCITEIFAVQIRRGIDEGVFDAQDDVDFLAQLIFATFLAAALNRTVLQPDLHQDELARRLTDYVLAGLK
jgi:hypothetical protein